MAQDAKVYIALEDEDGQLVVKGPLSLLDRLFTTLAGRKAPDHDQTTPAQAAQL